MMGYCLSILRRPRPQPGLLTSVTYGPQGPPVSGTSSGCVSQEEANEIPAAGDQPQDVPTSLASTDKTKGTDVPKHDSQTLVISSDLFPDCAVQEPEKEEPAGAYDQLLHVSSSSDDMDTNEEINLNIVQYSGQPPAISNSCLGYAEQEQDAEETPGAGEQIQHIALGSTEENEEIVITSLQATGVALGLRRVPAGFYVVLHHNGLEWRTENKSSSVNNDVIEWSGPIPIPSDLSAVIRLEVFASFEFQPMLGSGEHLRRLTTTVGQLLDRSIKNALFTFFPKDGDVVSPCSSIQVTVKQRKLRNCQPSGSRVVGPHWSTPQSRGELEGVTNRGHNALTRYRKHGEKQDLERSIQEFERALNICPWDHPCRAVAQSNLAMAKLILSQVDGTCSPLEAALQLYQDTLAARPVGHPDRPLTLVQLASVHFARFQRGRDYVNEADAENVWALLREAIEPSMTDDYGRQAATVMFQLCTAHRGGRVQSEGQSPMEQDLTPSLTEENPWDLSAWLSERFERFGNLADLQQAITILEGLVKSTPIWDRNYCVALGNLGVALSYRFEHLGQLDDLKDAISIQREAVRLSNEDHPHRPEHLNNLGTSFQTRFSRFGQLNDLEDAISTLREAAHISPDRHPNKPVYLSNLGYASRTRFLRLGQLGDLEDAISAQKEAVHLSPDGHPHKPAYINSLGNSFQARFERLGRLNDLEEAISRKTEAAQLTPDNHPAKPTYLSSLGFSFQTRFLRFGQLSDLEGAILAQRDAVRLTPSGHINKPEYLNNLGNSFHTRFKRLGHLTDLEDAISTQKEAVYLSDDDHPRKPGFLNNLGASLRARFLRHGELRDLEDAIQTSREAIHLSPDGHPHKPVLLNNLGTSLQTRFLHLGHISDLEDAISTQREAVHLSPDGHPEKRSYLNNLSASFQSRFLRLGQLSDLEDAISTQKEAVHLTPDSHPRKPSSHNNLGAFFQTRFSRLGRLSDLEDAISNLQQAIRLTPEGHPDMPGYLNNLGVSFQTRFSHLGHLNDLEDAISSQREAVHLTPDGHPRKLGYLDNLGTSFRTRFLRLGELNDLEDATSIQREVVHLILGNHPEKPGYLYNLATSLRMRFSRLGQLSDLEDAISTLRDAVHLIPHNHPKKPDIMNNLAESFTTRFLCTGRTSDIKHAVSLSSHVASTPVGPPNVRLYAAKHWILCARLIGHSSLLHAYSVSVRLLPQLAWVGLSLSHRYDELTRYADVVREAAAAALEAGFPETALEWLEQGRSVVWGDLFQLRSSYGELSCAHSDHAGRLHALSVQLDKASAAHEKLLSTPSEHSQNGTDHTTESLQQVADRHRALAIERDKLLQEIRRLPGFERFLLHKPFSRLRAAAHSGPVVVINAAETRCDALIVVAGVDHVIHVPLPNFTAGRCANLQVIMKGFVRDTRAGKLGKLEGISWDHILSPLWKNIVKPILDALAFSVTPKELSRIFWCPTGPLAFLPIHAAGFYNKQYSDVGNKVFDFVVSSYVPSLATLIPSLSAPAVPNDKLRLLAVRQPKSDGQSPLSGVITELAYVKDVVEGFPSAQVVPVESSVGTVEEVLRLMKESDWVHFACHGVQDGVDSGLCLADRRRLTLRDIVAVSRPRGGLAFLSACQTATGEKKLSDEAIHIAAGMLFAGYGGVIGTMWSISDNLAPRVARDVYTELLEKGKRPDYRDAAGALQETIGRLRNQEVPFEEWIPFIHVGL